MGLFFNVVLAVFAATGSFLFGYDSGSYHSFNLIDTRS
jgi:hypothetical protein